MSNPLQPDGPCHIVVNNLFSMINTRRKMLHLDPIENRAMASRCTLRFNLDRQRGVDFNNETISIAGQDMPILRDMINGQFGVNFENELISLCTKTQAEATPRMVTTHAPLPEPEPEVVVRQTGFGARLKRLFSGQ